jgi:hypothetical protein
MRRWNSLVALLVLISCLAWLAANYAADEPQGKEETKKAEAAAAKASPGLGQPKSMAFTARFNPPPNAAALLNAKQQRLRLHHRPLPVGKLPADVQAMPAPELATATSVLNLLGAAADASTVKVTVNQPVNLTGADVTKLTSTVCEPSLAVRGNEVLLTANWFAGFSTDGGGTFQYLNPESTFPSPPGRPFCCDQVALYSKAQDLMVWLMQHSNDDAGNILRVAVAQGDDIHQRNWHYYDFSPQSVGNWAKEWFDFPDLTLSNGYLYLSSNVFSTVKDPATGREPFKRSALLRLPLAQLAKYQALSYQYYSTEQFGGLRATHGATDTMYFVSHLNQAAVRVFTWPESSTTVSWNDVTVQSWSDQTRVAPGPDGNDWLGREDGRITASWLSGDTIGFAWTAAQDSNFAFPHARVALVDKNTKKVTGQPHIWNKEFAYAYPAAAPNANGRVGVSVFYGGGSLNPSHCVGTLLPSGKWDLVTTAVGKHGPNENLWGDYLSVRPHGEDPKLWSTVGYTLQTGGTRADVVVRYITFQP